MVFRIGGDEFAMLMFADGETSCKRAMKVLGSMNGKVSIGIATISSASQRFEKIEDFIRCADEALYHAKRSGRGRVVVSGCHKEGFIGCEEFCVDARFNAKRA
jgi:diguanylate cyclase (GGDEF)-like protein